jgi:hypothetical protein
MLAWVEQFEVLKAVVSFVVVTVVNLLVSVELSAQSTLHNEPMLEHVFPSRGIAVRVKDEHIPPGVDVASSSEVRVERLFRPDMELLTREMWPLTYCGIPRAW